MPKNLPAKLSESEVDGLLWLGSRLSVTVYRVPDKTERDAVGIITPGMNLFKRLISRGMCFQTIEDSIRFTDDPDEEPFTFSESIELTEEGDRLVAELRLCPYSH
jgi:hypothetical protein